MLITNLEAKTNLNQLNFIYSEMMAHPALFIHGNAKKIAILGDSDGLIAKEAAKHTAIKVSLQEMQETPFDIIIADDRAMISKSSFLKKCRAALTNEGILTFLGEPTFELDDIIKMHKKLLEIGFNDIQTLQFPISHQGWCFVWMATPRGVFRRASEKAIFNKTFATRYYNFDVHKAALAQPEFMREAFHSS